VSDLPTSAMVILRASARRYETASDSVTASDPTALLVELLVDLDLSTVDRFRRSFKSLLHEASGARPAIGDLIVLDLSRVDFIGVDGASALVDAKELAAGYGLELALVTATRGVEHALAATGVSQIFTCHGTVASALAFGSSHLGALTDLAY
jgi:anti-anti-sigma factor